MEALIALLPGDGIGPEVAGAGRQVLERIASRYGHGFEFTVQMIGGAAIDSCGDPLPADTVAACKDSAAVLLGAVGGPKWSDPNAMVRPEQVQSETTLSGIDFYIRTLTTSKNLI